MSGNAKYTKTLYDLAHGRIEGEESQKKAVDSIALDVQHEFGFGGLGQLADEPVLFAAELVSRRMRKIIREGKKKKRPLEFDVNMNFKLAEATRDRIRSAARNEDVSVSEWIRDAVEARLADAGGEL